ncbi:helicase C-terminal domain-containing protein, partial [Vibrio alginolyticus]|uniref:helicase C-terminal domain-containing protein n=1 Tax=Vibrio alginolyticus TaxID=663 RepID=UPI001AC6F143
PFAVPTDPLVAARTRYIEESGGRAFSSYSVPQAIITLKQGVGRLIRSRSDRGVVAILDPRLKTKSYGRQFLESLPRMRITEDPE